MPELLLNWVTCDGGPLLLVAKEHLPAWEGSADPSGGRRVEAQFRWNPEGPATDYDRACDISEYVGLIDVGEGKGLVLGGDEPFMTAWLPFASGGLLVRWVCANNESALVAAARTVPNYTFYDSGCSFFVGNSSLILLAACESSTDSIYPRAEFQLPSGRYRILTSEYNPDEWTSLICHRFENEALSRVSD